MTLYEYALLFSAVAFVAGAVVVCVLVVRYGFTRDTDPVGRWGWRPTRTGHGVAAALFGTGIAFAIVALTAAPGGGKERPLGTGLRAQLDTLRGRIAAFESAVARVASERVLALLVSEHSQERTTAARNPVAERATTRPPDPVSPTAAGGDAAVGDVATPNVSPSVEPNVAPRQERRTVRTEPRPTAAVVPPAVSALVDDSAPGTTQPPTRPRIDPPPTVNASTRPVIDPRPDASTQPSAPSVPSSTVVRVEPSIAGGDRDTSPRATDPTVDKRDADKRDADQGDADNKSQDKPPKAGRAEVRGADTERGGAPERVDANDKPAPVERADPPDKPAKVERADPPDKPARVERADRAERPAADRPERAERTTRPERVEIAVRPERPDRPDRPSKPEKVERPDKPEKVKPEKFERPERGGKR